MAGLYAIAGDNVSAGRMAQAAQRLRFSDETVEIFESPLFSVVWAGHDDVTLFGPAFDPRTGVRVIASGRVSWEESEWKRAEESRPFTGGLSNRLILARYLEGGIAAVERHNGPAAVVIWDPRSGTAHLLTDHFGYHPAFVCCSGDSWIVSTFPEAIADDPKVDVTSDLVSMAEFLRAWRVTPPHTYYEQIKYAGAATHWEWKAGHGEPCRRIYWKPYETSPFFDLESATDALTEAVTRAVRIRTLPRLCPVVSFTSGGMDSRVVLFGCADRSGLIALNLYDEANRESAISRRLAEKAGVRYIGFARDDDYYPRWMREGIRLSGAMGSAQDNHFLGTRDLTKSLGAKTVMTACTTDWLFKGYGMEKTYRRFAGRNLPLKKFTNERVDGFLPNVPRPAPREYASQVEARMNQWFEGTERRLTSRQRLLVEDKRVRPACYAVSVSGPIMYRAFPYDTFLADRGVADCYARLRPEWKLNSDLWAHATRKICTGAEGIVDANFGWKVGSSELGKMTAFAVGWFGRRLRPRKDTPRNSPAIEGSWPDYGWYCLHSRTLRDRWEGVTPDCRHLITRLWGDDPWSLSLADWAANPNDLLRIMTLAGYLESRAEKRGRP